MRGKSPSCLVLFRAWRSEWFIIGSVEMTEEKFKSGVTKSRLRRFYSRAPRGVVIQMCLLCLWTRHALHYCSEWILHFLHCGFLFGTLQKLETIIRLLISQPIVGVNMALWWRGMQLLVLPWFEAKEIAQSVWYMITLYNTTLLYSCF